MVEAGCDEACVEDVFTAEDVSAAAEECGCKDEFVALYEKAQYYKLDL